MNANVDTSRALFPSEALTEVIAGAQTGIPIMRWGDPGVGKSSIFEQATAELGWHYVPNIPSVASPTMPTGMPWMEGGKADFRPYGKLRKFLEATEPTLWVWDDFGQAAHAVQC